MGEGGVEEGIGEALLEAKEGRAAATEEGPEDGGELRGGGGALGGEEGDGRGVLGEARERAGEAAIEA